MSCLVPGVFWPLSIGALPSNLSSSCWLFIFSDNSSTGPYIKSVGFLSLSFEHMLWTSVSSLSRVSMLGALALGCLCGFYTFLTLPRGLLHPGAATPRAVHSGFAPGAHLHCGGSVANGPAASVTEPSACQTTETLRALPMRSRSEEIPKGLFWRRHSEVLPLKKTRHSKENSYLNCYHIHVLLVKIFIC